MNQLCNDYAKGQQTYPVTVKNLQALLTAWEGENAPLHIYNEGLSFPNVVNGKDSNRGATRNGDTQASGGRASCG